MKLILSCYKAEKDNDNKIIIIIVTLVNNISHYVPTVFTLNVKALEKNRYNDNNLITTLTYEMHVNTSPNLKRVELYHTISISDLKIKISFFISKYEINTIMVILYPLL